ncbi:MAG: hypothetical protein HY231_21310 [Acidobacteria bacterium]|nr:hypothetical protein [Acidobacteriota bacterium]
MLKAFADLGNTVNRLWAERHYDEAVFAEIARNALTESRVLENVEPSEIIHWLSSSAEVPPQELRNFGQPPINLYLSERFLIEALFWLDATTAIHQHAFAGAFGVLAGSSVHSEYHFQQEEAVSKQLKLGAVKFRSAELLQRGDIRAIAPGEQFIHALFHLDRPSLTIVIRTKFQAHLEPQYAYLKPWLAIDPFYQPTLALTQIRLLEALKQTDLQRFWQTAETLIESCDLWMAYKILAMVQRKFQASEPWHQLLKRAHKRHGERLNWLLPCLQEQSREIQIIARREIVHEADYRFFLALLLNVPDKDLIYQLLVKRYPHEEPEALVLKWLQELSERKLIALEFNALSLRMVQLALRGFSFERAQVAVRQAFSLAETAEVESKLTALWSELRNTPILRPLTQ